MDHNLLENVYLRLLTEAEEQILAAHVIGRGLGTAAYLYNPTVAATSSAADAIRGYISVAPAKEPCNKSWTIKGSWGPGIGELLYNIGFALTPNGTLMPDRMFVSPNATGRWKKIFFSKKMQTLPVDDSSHPEEPHGHTETTSDDCYVHQVPGEEYVDYTYQMSSSDLDLYRSKLSQMENNHEGFLKKVIGKAAGPKFEVESMKFEEELIIAGKKKFYAALDAL